MRGFYPNYQIILHQYLLVSITDGAARRGMNHRLHAVLISIALLLLIVVGPAHSSTSLAQPTQSTCVQPPSGLISWWPGEGDTNDIGGSNNGTLVGGATFVSGKVGQAFQFNGTDSFVTINSQIYSLSGGTVELWFLREGVGSVSSPNTIVGSYGGTGNQRAPTFFVPGGDGSTLRWEFGSLITRDTQKTIHLNEWHHAAMTYDGNFNVKVYFDGALVASATSQNPGDFFNQVHIGHYANFGQEFFPGRMDEVAIYNRPLDAAEIQAIYNAGSAGKCRAGGPTSSISGRVTDANSLESQIAVDARTEWQDTGIAVQTGDQVQVIYRSGTWTIWKGVDPYTDANGQVGRTNECTLPLPSANIGGLVGRVSTGAVQFFGNAGSLVAQTSGTLHLSMNDCTGHFQDNDGTLTVQVTVTPAISGVTIADGAGHTATTDASGNYTISGLAAGTYTLTPSKTGYTFSPTSRSITLPPDAQEINFTGIAAQAGPVAYYSFDGDLTDHSGNNQHGSAQGSIPFVQGIVGQAASFSGATWMSVNASLLPVGNTARSICLWAKSADGKRNGNADHLANWGTAAAGQAFGLMIFVGDTWWGYGHEFQTYDTDSGVKADTNWHYLCNTYDGAKMQVYVDGTLRNERVVALNTAGTTFYVASRPDRSAGNTYDGLIDEVRIYNRSLSTQDIFTLYASTASQSCGPASDEASLNNTIACVNAAGSGIYMIQITADIALTQPPMTLTNRGVTQVVIEGNNHTLNAQGHGRVLTFDSVQNLTLRNLTLAGGKADASDVFANGGGLSFDCRDDLACTWTVVNVVVRNNQARLGGGINYRCSYHGGGALVIQDSVIRDNQASEAGGGIVYSSDEESGLCSLTLRNTLVEGNQSIDGGAIRLYRPRVTIINSTIRNNVASQNGGGLMLAQSDGFIDMTMRGSTVSSNRAGLNGGGLYIASPEQTIDVKLANSTVSGNTVTNGAGGGLYLRESDDSLRIALLNSTVTQNAAGQGAGVHIFHQDTSFIEMTSTLRLTNSIVANNLGSDCEGDVAPGVVFTGKRVTSYGNNLDGDGTCLPTDVRLPSDIPDGNANLGPLADNGGPTWTHLLLTGSNAIDAGNDVVCAAEPVSSVDQRGIIRPQGAHCDIGAVEPTEVDFCSDIDSDRLCDDWELHGHNGVNLPAMGATPNHKDIFVEIDYMVEPGHCLLGQCIFGHTHKPKPEAIAKVVEAFKFAPISNPDGVQGINLHVDFGSESTMKFELGRAIKWDNLSRSNGLSHDDDLSWTEFADFKRIPENFDPARRQIFHYAIFAHFLDGNRCTSGEAPFRGVDLIVSLGGWGNFYGGQCDPNTRREVGTIDQQAGTFMHELGHNLGLNHGGGDGVNNKPNYLSIMNYLFQTRGLTRLTSNGNKETVFDYSRSDKIPPLDETSLDERIGLNGGSSTANYGTRWYCGTTIQSADLANSPINWNCNGNNTEVGITANINDDSLCINPGKDGVLNSTTTGDDVIIGTTIHDGSDRICNSSASGGDEQIRAVEVAQPLLVGFFDWANIDYGARGEIGLLQGQGSQDVSILPKELTFEEDSRLISPYEVSVSGPGEMQVVSGTSATYSFIIRNLGSSPDTYTLSASSSQGWADVSSVPSSVNLAPGGIQEIQIKITSPQNVKTGSVDELKLVATSQGLPSRLDVASTKTTVAGLIYLPLIQK